MAVLSGFHLRELLAEDRRAVCRISLDLGRTLSDVRLGKEIMFPDGQRLPRSLLEQTVKKRTEHDCFCIERSQLTWLYEFDSVENHSYKLYEPARDWSPTVMIDSAFMHTVSTATPTAEAAEKVKAAGRVEGCVLETCMGLGYCTAEVLSRPVSEVVACEVSDIVTQFAQANPWSQEVFDDPRLSVRCGSVVEILDDLEPESMDCVIHDPPTQHRAGELYSMDMYMKLFRALRKGGRLYHYTGTETRNTRHRFREGAARRLSEAGFSRVAKAYRGLCAVK